MLTEFKLTKSLTLKNRLLMAPMTRVKAADDFIPTEAMADYYARRADSGLIITEGTIIHPSARNHNHVPGIFNLAQINAWQKVTDRVHHHHGNIFSQIWHVGRVSHPSFLHGELPISASATTMTGRLSRSDLTYGSSRAASIAEINQIIEWYAEAANNAIKAGFDGIEIHGANGYLVDQFLHYDTNLREDEYGQTPENMARFALQIVKACGEMIGYERVGIRLSPGAYLNEIKGDIRDGAVFKHLLAQLHQYPIAYVHTGAFDDSKAYAELDNQTMSAFIRQHYRGVVIACGGYTVEKAEEVILNKKVDLVAIGRPFIANPDLIARVTERGELKQYDVSMLNELY